MITSKNHKNILLISPEAGLKKLYSTLSRCYHVSSSVTMEMARMELTLSSLCSGFFPEAPELILKTAALHNVFFFVCLFFLCSSKRLQFTFLSSKLFVLK